MTDAHSGNPQDFRLYGLLAETFIHPGTGQSRAAIDLPVARESTTNYPYIAGSSVKGAARDAFRRHWSVAVAENGRAMRKATDAEVSLFGPEGGAGSDGGAGELIFSEVWLLFLPVRSLTGACRYVTCPELIYRLLANLKRAGLSGDTAVSELAQAAKKFVPPDNDSNSIALSKAHAGGVYLEELCFKGQTCADVGKLATCVMELLPSGSGMAASVATRLTIVSDDAFNWFAENALPVRMRNALGENKKVIEGALWSEEYLAPDTLMYMLVGTRGSPAGTITLPGNSEPNGQRTCAVSEAFQELLAKNAGYMQIGGNETVGHGWFNMRRFKAPQVGGSK